MTTTLALSLKEDVSLTYVVLRLLVRVSGQAPRGSDPRGRVGRVLRFRLGGGVVVGGLLRCFGQRFAGDRGESVGDAVVWALDHPLETASDMASQSLFPFLLILLSTAALPLLGGTWMLLAAPTAAYNAFSAYTPQHDLDNHYHLFTVAGLFVAAAVGVVRLPSLARPARLAAVGGLTAAVWWRRSAATRSTLVRERGRISTPRPPNERSTAYRRMLRLPRCYPRYPISASVSRSTTARAVHFIEFGKLAQRRGARRTRREGSLRRLHRGKAGAYVLYRPARPGARGSRCERVARASRLRRHREGRPAPRPRAALITTRPQSSGYSSCASVAARARARP